MMKTKIVLVGGFLGAGKTTLLGEAAQRLGQAGKQVGLITNDQASELVDTAVLEQINASVAELSGSCFCCNFAGFSKAITYITENKTIDVIFAEPVGSCTDLSATILQPMKHKFADDLSVAPLSVLVDPKQLVDILDGRISGLHTSAVYILRKQLEEADFIVINKTDVLGTDELMSLKQRTTEVWPWAKVFTISAQTGDNVDFWLTEVLRGSEAGTHLAELDYDIYAEGEAVLGWLNTTVKLESELTNWGNFTENLLKALRRRFEELNSVIGHVKLIIKTGSGFTIGNITGPDNFLNLRGTAGEGQAAVLTLNARAQIEPEQLKTIVLEEIAKLCASNINPNNVTLNSLQPGRPSPTYRYDHVVDQVS